MSSDFDQATAVSEIAADVFEWVVPDGWQQGRGAWGGLPIGALIKCVIAAQSGGGFGAELNDDQRLVRSLNCQIYAPVLVGAQRVTTAGQHRPGRRGSLPVTRPPGPSLPSIMQAAGKRAL